MINRRALIASAAGLAATGAARAGNSHHIVRSPAFVWREDASEAPFGDRIPASITNYSRVSPYVALGGVIEPGGLDAAKALGFKQIIDFRRPDEAGVTEEQAEAKTLGLAWTNMPVPATRFEADFLKAFRAIVSDPANYPVLAHCASANRASAVWAVHRAESGAPPLVAIEEGRAAGLKSRETMVRRHLKLPPA